MMSVDPLKCLVTSNMTTIGSMYHLELTVSICAVDPVQATRLIDIIDTLIKKGRVSPGHALHPRPGLERCCFCALCKHSLIVGLHAQDPQYQFDKDPQDQFYTVFWYSLEYYRSIVSRHKRRQYRHLDPQEAYQSSFQHQLGKSKVQHKSWAYIHV